MTLSAGCQDRPLACIKIRYWATDWLALCLLVHSSTERNAYKFNAFLPPGFRSPPKVVLHSLFHIKISWKCNSTISRVILLTKGKSTNEMNTQLQQQSWHLAVKKGWLAPSEYNCNNIAQTQRTRYRPLYSVDTCPRRNECKYSGGEVDKDAWGVALVPTGLPQFIQTWAMHRKTDSLISSKGYWTQLKSILKL